MNVQTPTRPSTFAEAILASLAFGWVELAAFAFRHARFSAESLVELAVFSLVASVLVGAVAGLAAMMTPGRLRGSGASWALTAWVFLLVCPRSICDGVSGLEWLELCGALALGYATLRVALIAARAAPIVGSLRAWAIADSALLLVLCAFMLMRRQPATPPEPAEGVARPSILLVTIDTLRADFVGCYGRAQARTSVLDGLAASGYLLENAVTHALQTGPSHTTILTGLLPLHHGVTQNIQRVERKVSTLAEQMSRLGYRTGAFVSGYPLTQQSSALPARFESWDDDFREWRCLSRDTAQLSMGRWLWDVLERFHVELDPHSRSASAVTAIAIPWLAEPSKRPFFGWVHYFDPHLPYEPPPSLLLASTRAYRGPATGDWYPLSAPERERIIEDPEALAHMNELYDAEVANVDGELAHLIEAARAHAGPAGVWIIVTADHGESFGEHGVYFSRDLYEASLHVPLIIVPPTPLPSGKRIDEPVGLVDLAPTMMEIAGAQLPCDGNSLLPLLRGEPWPSRTYVSEIFPTTPVPYRRASYSVREHGWKLIVNQKGWKDGPDWSAVERTELYDLTKDRDESDDLAPREEPRTVEMKTRAKGLHREREAAAVDISPEQLDHLRSLGYAH